MNLRHSALDVGIEMFALRSKPDSAVGPDEEDTADFFLQPIHGSCDIGLVASENSGSLGEVLIFCHVIEDSIVFQIYIVHASPFLSLDSCVQSMKFQKLRSL